MKYIAGILIGAGLTGVVWTAAKDGPNGWAICIAVGLVLMVASEVAKHNGHES